MKKFVKLALEKIPVIKSKKKMEMRKEKNISICERVKDWKKIIIVKLRIKTVKHAYIYSTIQTLLIS